MGSTSDKSVRSREGDKAMRPFAKLLWALVRQVIGVTCPRLNNDYPLDGLSVRYPSHGHWYQTCFCVEAI